MADVHGEGSFKVVYKGAYTHGERAGQPCVMKIVRKTEAASEQGRDLESVFDRELEITRKSQEIIDRFNAAALCASPIFLNRPAVWTFEAAAGAWAGVKCLVEPFIEGYRKFNSNSGWAASAERGEAWAEVMQALSHFSYDMTGGSFVLCDLQGGAHGGGVVLTDPVVMSRDRRYGPQDLGAAGIDGFFAHHKCSRYCRMTWTQPRDKPGQVHLPPVSGTSMMDSKSTLLVPSRPARPLAAVIAERAIKGALDTGGVGLQRCRCCSGI